MTVMEAVLDRLLDKADTPGCNHHMMCAAYAAALYAASAAINMEGAQARDISETAFRIEHRPDPTERTA